jgi:Tol biopolymer transport system component
MKNNKRLLPVIIAVTLIMAASISYLLLSDRDSYKYFSGLGNGLSISHDDQRLAFSYYQNGIEAIYTADLDGNNVQKVTHPKQERHRIPEISPDGSKLLFLSQNKERIQSLFIANLDGSNPKKLSDAAQHVSDAIFSKDGKSIYYVSMPAEDSQKSEGETREGQDLFSIDLDGSKISQLTDKDHFTMESLSLSADGNEIQFKDYTELYVYNLKEKREYVSDLSAKMPAEPFHLTVSPERKAIAYTAVSKESMDSSLYEYELFLRDLVNGETKRLTNLKKAVVSPVFFHQEDTILFLEHTNWAQDPEQYKLMTVDIDTENTTEIHLDMPGFSSGNVILKAVDYAVNSWTIVLLYMILLFLLTLYFQQRKLFFPSFISLAIAVLSVAASFIVAASIDPWAGIGIGMLSAGILLCTLASFIFAIGIKFYRKKKM